VAKNQHRWKQYLLDDERKVRLLEELAVRLRWSWNVDSKHETSFPINTNQVFSDLRRILRGCIWNTHGLPPPPPLPKRFADLFDEKGIKSMYELQHNDSYEKALRLAGARERGAYKAFHNLMSAARAEYEWSFFGSDAIPRPKIHFLHRELLDLAAILKLDELTNQGLEEFFDDICPCTKKHNAEAIRKLRKRKNAPGSSR
jgi:hypothetical protein